MATAIVPIDCACPLPQAMQISIWRHANRPMKTFEEPVLIWKNGECLAAGRARPRSPDRGGGHAADQDPDRCAERDRPQARQRYRGAGGIRDGDGCVVMPMYNMLSVAAGKLGKAAAIGFVRLAKPTLAMSWRTFMAPMTVPTVCWTLRSPATAFSPKSSCPNCDCRTFGASRRSP